jgi:hypothetical protein
MRNVTAFSCVLSWQDRPKMAERGGRTVEVAPGHRPSNRARDAVELSVRAPFGDVLLQRFLHRLPIVPLEVLC